MKSEIILKVLITNLILRHIKQDDINDKKILISHI